MGVRARARAVWKPLIYIITIEDDLNVLMKRVDNEYK